jgi:2-C-methyl-D-erythritol 4-phosphate cytidylyltransferase
MAKFSVIVAAAGKAERFGSGEKKTFAKLEGRPVFLRSVEHFINREDVCQTILAVASQDIDRVKSSYGANPGKRCAKLVSHQDTSSATSTIRTFFDRTC